MTTEDIITLPRRQVSYRHGQWVVLDRQTGVERPADDKETAGEHMLLAHFIDVILDGIRPAAYEAKSC
jgi:hypothetical protein